eukprot:GFUD01021941.1.p1 GENE.GFUD01021941.1~~GFUD01021941.1.p1  ORF type:complete len:223 (+),score=60.62 GFUD01021941.1:145-813(+)
MNRLICVVVAVFVAQVAFLDAAPPGNTKQESVEEVEVVVGVEESKIVEVNSKSANPTKIAGSLVKDVKQINLFLNIPVGCNSIYDQLIKQLVACRNGSDRGHPRLDKGCLLRMDFRKFKDECAETGVFFPSVGETPWHPEPTCNGRYCEESSDLAFSTKSSKNTAANVAFPGQEDDASDVGYSKPSREEKTIDKSEPVEDDTLVTTLLDILNTQGKTGPRIG